MENNLSQRQNVNHSAEKFNFHPFLVFITLLWITFFRQWLHKELHKVATASDFRGQLP